ncbi:MAG: energy transducer TonB [Candidatus Eremiobacteraeota bacterium]|nr:energy transducer TonB [Candidatus Eremiobacteraeota bacterium]
MIGAAFVAAIIAASPAPTTVRGSTAACPRDRGHVIEESQLEFPQDAHPTHGRVRFFVDLGSDGRVRRSSMMESTGDAALDAAAAKALAEYRFAMPSAGCVTTSSTIARWWNIPPAALASPSPAPEGVPISPSSPVPCVAPFIRPIGFPLPRRREVPGTASVDVGIDASARVTAVHLVQSSGNKKTDYAATVAARNGLYVFERQPGCAPVATTYRLELTFR